MDDTSRAALERDTGDSLTFEVQDAPKDAFRVAALSGREILARPYVFDIDLVSEDPSIKPAELINKTARLTLSKNGAKRGGLVASMSRVRSVDNQTLYAVTMVPRLWLLGLTRHNQIFLDKTLPQIIEAVFRERGLTRYEFRLVSSYPAMEYVCQYNETHLHFLERWMESRGLYYFFEQGDDGEKVVVADNNLALTGIAPVKLRFAPPSGLDLVDTADTVSSLTSRLSIVPGKVKLKDYNYRNPRLELSAEAVVAENGVGEVYSYGDNFKTPGEGDKLAKVRAEEFLCRQQVFPAETFSRDLSAGRIFRLNGHPDRDFDADYLVESVEHRGHQTGFLLSGLAPELASLEGRPDYLATVTALRPDKTYRPARLTERTVFHGFVNAFIDAVGSGQYAELDAMGRYKVRLPFDLAGEPDGKASSWLRLAEPYAGDDMGMHFPLHKGTEVLLVFMNGDPDRPIIAAAAHNADVRNPIKDQNARLSGIKTAGNNQLVMSDIQGREFLALYSPFHQTGIALGAVEPGGGGSIVTQTKGQNETFVLGAYNQATVGTQNYFVGGVSTNTVIGSAANLQAGINLSYNLLSSFNVTKGNSITLGEDAYDFKDVNDTCGLTRLTLGGGVQAGVAAALKSARTSLILATAGVAAAAAGATIETELFSEDGALSSTDKTWKITGGVLAGILAAAGVGMLVSAGVIGYQACTAFETASQAARAGNIILDNGGVNITCNTPAAPGAKFLLFVGTPGVPQTQLAPAVPAIGSQIEVSASGNAITLTNKTNGSITMDSVANSIVIAKTGGGTVTVDATGVKAEMAAGGSVTISNTGVVMQQAAGAKVETTAASVKLTAANDIDSVTVANTGIQLNFAGGNLQAGATLKIDQAGLIYMG